MAIIYAATLTPGKKELLQAWLDGQPGDGRAGIELIGSYRYDDPADEVGVEAFLVLRGGEVLHVPLTYRGAPLDGSEAALIGTTEHSELGTRWVYDGRFDPVAVSCYERALRGAQEQAVEEVWDGASLVERREPRVRVHLEPGVRGGTDPSRPAVDDPDGSRVEICREVGQHRGGAEQQLVAEWAGGGGVVAVLRSGLSPEPGPGSG